MARLIPSDKGAKGVDVRTERGVYKYNVDSRGGIEVENRNHAKQMVAEGGFFEAAALGASIGKGFPCAECGFGSWFKTCSRCGAVNE